MGVGEFLGVGIYMTWDVREAHKMGRGIKLRLQPLQLAHVAKRRTKEMPNGKWICTVR